MGIEQIIPGQSEYEKLLKEIRELQARIVELTAIRDDLLYHVCPSLRAIYDEKIGSIEREILAAKLYLREKQRILQILQAQLNRQEIVSVKDAEEKAGEEFRQFEEDLHKKAEEAEQFNKRWKKTWWQSHEEEARRNGGSFGDQGNSAEDKAGNASASGKDGDGSNPNEAGSDEESSDNGSPGKGGSGKNGSGKDASGKGASSGSGNFGSDSDDDDDFGEGAKKPKDPIEALKRLYRKIVKRLHPDVNPDLTEHEKELFNEATDAYKTGDLEKMQSIWEELESGTDPETRFEGKPEDLEKLRKMLAKLRERVRGLSDEISHIRSEYPYTMKEFLENEDAVDAKRSELQKQLKEIRDADEKLAEFIEQVRKKVKDPWNN